MGTGAPIAAWFAIATILMIAGAFTAGPRAAKPCDHYTTEHGYCGRTDGVRQFLPGWRCPDHTPNALAGLPEPTVDPATTLDGLRAAVRGDR